MKTTGQGRVFLEIFFIFGPRGGGDCAEFTASKRWLEHVGRISLACLPTGADECVGFVYKENDWRWRLLDLFDHALEPIFKLAFHACTRLQEAQIERAEGNFLQRFRHVATGDALRKSFNNGRFSNACFARENRIVLSATREDIDDLPHLRFAAEHRIDLAGFGPCGEVDRVLVKVWRGRGAFGLAIGADCGGVASSGTL